MAYIDSATVKEIRQKIKKEFPRFKFSITCRDYCEVSISVMSATYDFGVEHQQVNHYYINENYKDKPEQAKFLNRLLEICEEVKQTKIVNANTDYGDWPNYYKSLAIGKWDKPYTLIKDEQQAA